MPSIWQEFSPTGNTGSLPRMLLFPEVLFQSRSSVKTNSVHDKSFPVQHQLQRQAQLPDGNIITVGFNRFHCQGYEDKTSDIPDGNSTGLCSVTGFLLLSSITLQTSLVSSPSVHTDPLCPTHRRDLRCVTCAKNKNSSGFGDALAMFVATSVRSFAVTVYCHP